MCVSVCQTTVCQLQKWSFSQVTYNLVIGGSVFPYKKIHKTTWVSLDHVTENQIDHICISTKFRRTMEDARTRRGADTASDHNLLGGEIQTQTEEISSCNRPENKIQHQLPQQVSSETSSQRKIQRYSLATQKNAQQTKSGKT